MNIAQIKYSAIYSGERKFDRDVMPPPSTAAIPVSYVSLLILKVDYKMQYVFSIVIYLLVL